jgi:hypothetical protein
VPKLLAIAYIAENPREFGLEIPWHEEYHWVRIAVDRPCDLTVLAAYAEIDPQEMLNANREVLHGVLPGDREHYLKLRDEHLKAVSAVIARENLPLIQPNVHVVADGETLYSIARRYGVSVDLISSLNKNMRADALKPGERILIPAEPQIASVAKGRNES